MHIVEPIAVIIAVSFAVFFMRETPRLFALLIVRIADRLLAARHTANIEALNGRQAPTT